MMQNDMENALRHHLIRFFKLLLIWSVPGTISFLQGWVVYEGMSIKVTALENAIIAFGAWWGWIPITPFVVWLGRRYDARRWRNAAFIHLPASMIFGVGFLLWSAVLSYHTATEWPISLERTLINEVLFVHLVALIYWAVLGVAYALDYQAKYQDERDRAVLLDLEKSKLALELTEARLAALQMQLQPHFLFNSLHAVSALMSKDVKAARKMLVQLADLLRTVLDQGDVAAVELRREIEWLRQYLDIESMRFGDRLKCEIKISRDAENILIPPFILQPIVENAIKHGIEKSAAAGQVSVTARIEVGQLIVDVADDGPGFSGEVGGRGVGLTNTKERLKTLFGDKGTLAFSSPTSGTGAVVRISIPLDLAEAEDQHDQ